MTTPRFKLTTKWYEPPSYRVFTDDLQGLGTLQRTRGGWIYDGGPEVGELLLCESDQDPYVAQLCVRAYLKGRGL